MGKDVPMVNRASGNFYDEITAKMVAQFGDKNAREVIAHSAFGRYLDIRKSNLSNTFGPAPTTATGQILYDDHTGAHASSIGLAHDIIKAAEDKSVNKIYHTNLNDAKSFELKNLISSLLTGTISHGAAEALQKGIENYAGTADAQKALTQLTNIFGAEEAQKKFEEAKHRGEENYKYISNYVLSNGGEIIGSEMGLAGFSKLSNGEVRATRQIADIIYKMGS